ncbi:MAG: tRNA-guanine transglycosylase, partial [Proteobacteria bacterium]|nr:tRNA-guanine transglycosylase [Pseudomonadota bacterium]
TRDGTRPYLFGVVQGGGSEALRRECAQALVAIGIDGVVVNAFHLMRAPGTRLVKSAGGIHRFMDWDHPVVSDSGGFQVYSLIRQDPTAGTIRPNEVIFKEASTGEKVILSPEKVILSQLQLGSDILYCLDDCTDAEVDAAEQARAVERTVRWAAKGRATFDAQVRSTTKRAARRDAASDGTATRDGTRPYLFGVVQGGGSEALRRECAQALVAIGGAPARYAVARPWCRPPRPCRARPRTRVHDFRLHPAHARRKARPVVRVARWLPRAAPPTR